MAAAQFTAALAVLNKEVEDIKKALEDKGVVLNSHTETLGKFDTRLSKLSHVIQNLPVLPRGKRKKMSRDNDGDETYTEEEVEEKKPRAPRKRMTRSHAEFMVKENIPLNSPKAVYLWILLLAHDILKQLNIPVFRPFKNTEGTEYMMFDLERTVNIIEMIESLGLAAWGDRSIPRRSLHNRMIQDVQVPWQTAFPTFHDALVGIMSRWRSPVSRVNVNVRDEFEKWQKVPRKSMKALNKTCPLHHIFEILGPLDRQLIITKDKFNTLMTRENLIPKLKANGSLVSQITKEDLEKRLIFKRGAGVLSAPYKVEKVGDEVRVYAKKPMTTSERKKKVDMGVDVPDKEYIVKPASEYNQLAQRATSHRCIVSKGVGSIALYTRSDQSGPFDVSGYYFDKMGMDYVSTIAAKVAMHLNGDLQEGMETILRVYNWPFKWTNETFLDLYAKELSKHGFSAQVNAEHEQMINEAKALGLGDGIKALATLMAKKFPQSDTKTIKRNPGKKKKTMVSEDAMFADLTMT